MVSMRGKYNPFDEKDAMILSFPEPEGVIVHHVELLTTFHDVFDVT
jgi:hypothetical protein